MEAVTVYSVPAVKVSAANTKEDSLVAAGAVEGAGVIVQVQVKVD